MSLVDLDARVDALDAAVARLAALNANIDAVTAEQTSFAHNTDVAYIGISFFLVFLLHVAMNSIEGGANRRGTAGSAVMRNAATTCVAAVVWWLWGYGISFGVSQDDNKNGFVGNTDFILVTDTSMPIETYGLWVLQLSYCAFSMYVVLGSSTERMSMFGAYLFSLVFSGLIYPIIAHWTWSKSGWLSAYNEELLPRVGKNGLIDLAGSATIHICGGFAALAACIVLGPRKERFEKQDPTAFTKGCSQYYKFFGTLFFIFGFIGFTTGSTLSVTGNKYTVVCRILINTVLALSGGGIVGLLGSRGDHTATSSGIIAGLVAVAAGCGVYAPWAAFVTGVVGGAFYLAGAGALAGARIDDATNGFAMHGLAGVWGTLAVGIFATKDNVVDLLGAKHSEKFGFLYGGGAEQFGVQLLGVVVVAAWAFFFTAVFLGIGKAIGKARVSEETEAISCQENAAPEAYSASFLGFAIEQDDANEPSESA